MPKAKAIPSLSGMIDSDMEEPSDVDMMPTPDSNQENAEPTKKAPGRPKAAATKGRKTKPASRRLSGGPKPKAAAKKKAPAKRAPLKEQTNEEQAEEIEEVDEFMDEVSDTLNKPEARASEEEEADELVQPKKQPAKRGRAAAKAKQPPKKDPVEQPKIVENDGEFEYTPTAAKQSKLASKKAAAGKRQASAEPKPFEKVIPETQPIPMETESSALQEADEEEIPQSVYRQSNHARATSKQTRPQVAQRRAGSASDTERAGNDPALRRKLGEMTKKFENLDLKYRNLREVGIKEAEANFEKLKTQSEERTKAANDLIASLKKELSTQKSLAATTQTLRTTLAATESSLSTAQARITQLTTSLTEAQNETKSLSAKLAASRNASATIEAASNAKTPGSNMKGKTPATRTIMVGSAEAAQAAQVAQLKEELYADLTGLILRGVDRLEDADVYDCIQTGRNGTLHFKLAVATDTSAATSYEETEFQYTPRLDRNRDRDLLEILPDYLTEEITFSRQHAAKFYSRVVETLTKKMEDLRGGDEDMR
ncbi:hypothetical protein MMC30_009318 [Trapelia coarctata]|nr:hypothetical protein [Trapelia coarctata]